MGKATITAGGADGSYTITLDTGKATQTTQLARLDARLAELLPQIESAKNYLLVQQVLEAMAEAAVLVAIEDYTAATRQIPLDTAAVKTALDAYTKLATKLQDEKRLTAPLQLKLDLLEAAQAQAKKDRAAWATLVLEESRQAWCADLTEDASGVVATLEIPGESQLVLIAPAAPAPLAEDGLLTAREVQSAAQVFLNAAALPGWQKWMPTYRRGVITAVNPDTDTVALTLTPDKSSAQALGINQTETLADVPVKYMECNSGAFEVGDACVVKFTDHDWAKPQVVGFVDNPKSCAGLELLVFPRSTANSNGLGSPATAVLTIGKTAKVKENVSVDAFATDWRGEQGDLILYDTGTHLRYFVNPNDGVPTAIYGLARDIYVNEEKVTVQIQPHGVGMITVGDERYIIVAANVGPRQTSFYVKHNTDFLHIGDVTCATDKWLGSTWIFSPDGTKAASIIREANPIWVPAANRSVKKVEAEGVEAIFTVVGGGVMMSQASLGVFGGAYPRLAPEGTYSSELVQISTRSWAYRETSTFSRSRARVGGAKLLIGFEYVAGVATPVLIDKQDLHTKNGVVSEVGEAAEYIYVPGPDIDIPQTSYQTYTEINESHLQVLLGDDVFFDLLQEDWRYEVNVSGPKPYLYNGSLVQTFDKLVIGLIHVDARNESVSFMRDKKRVVVPEPLVDGESQAAAVETGAATASTELWVKGNKVANTVTEFPDIGPVPSAGYVTTQQYTLVQALWKQDEPPDMLVSTLYGVTSVPGHVSRQTGEVSFSVSVASTQPFATSLGASTNIPLSYFATKAGEVPNVATQFTLGAEAGFVLNPPKMIPGKKQK